MALWTVANNNGQRKAKGTAVWQTESQMLRTVVGAKGDCMEERLLRLPQVLEKVPVSKSAWWDGIRKGIYPPGLKLTARTTVWKLSSINEVIARVGA